MMKGNYLTDVLTADKFLMRRTFMYSPKINEELVKALYLEKQKVGKPMTKLVNEAIMEYLEKRRSEDDQQRQNNIGSD